MLTWRSVALSACVMAFAAAAQYSILSATYGLAGCIGVDTGDTDKLKKKGCVVTSNGKTSAISRLQARALCGSQSPGHIFDSADALPVTFSAPMEQATVKPEYFEFLLSDGSSTKSMCVNPRPANEDNEMQTLATIGYYGDGWQDVVYPVQLTIVGELKFIDGTSAKGLTFKIPHENRFATDSPFVVQADVLQFTTKGETDATIRTQKTYPNHCQQLYPSTTHRIRLVLNGGSTLDGVNGLMPNMTDVFHVLNAAGERITGSMILGLADLGSEPAQGYTPDTYTDDGDNFFDICLNDSKGSLADIASVHMPCDSPGVNQLVLPKGKPVCTPNTLNVTLDNSV